MELRFPVTEGRGNGGVQIKGMIDKGMELLVICVKRLWDTCQIWAQSREFTVHASNNAKHVLCFLQCGQDSNLRPPA